MPNIPTQENIISITYQLLQEVTVPLSIRGQMPLVTVQFQDVNGILRTKAVSFQEMLPYFRYLKLRADLLGKTLLCSPAITFDKKIVLNYGDALDGNPIVVQVANSPANPCATTTIVIFITHAPPIIVGDILYIDSATTLPLLGFDLVADSNSGIIYGLNPATGQVLAATGNTCTVPPPVNLSADVTMQLNGIDFVANNQLAGIVNVTGITAFSIINAFNTPLIASFRLPIRGFGSFNEDYNKGVFTNYFISAQLNATLDYWNCVITYPSNGVSGAATINIINSPASAQTVVKFTIIDPIFAYDGVVSYNNNNIAQTALQAGFAEQGWQAENGQYIMSKINDNINSGYNIMGLTSLPNIIFIARFKLNNIVIGSTAPSTFSYGNVVTIGQTQGLPLSANYDEIEIIPVPVGIGFPINAGYGANPAAACAATPTTVYTATGTIITGIFVFTDAAMTIPLAGQDFIQDSAINEIFPIDNITGLVGATTGVFC